MMGKQRTDITDSKIEYTLTVAEETLPAAKDKGEASEAEPGKSEHGESAQREPVPNKALVAWISLVMLLCLLPFVGMLWAPTATTSGDTAQTQLPSLVQEDGTVNVNALPELGAYFEEHFAYRNLAIDLDAYLKAGFFATSPTDQVIVGADGWLYYGGTLRDYLALDPLTEREVISISHNLALAQGYVQAKGADFALSIAPNKNSLYPEHMPYYYAQGDNQTATLLKQQFEDAGVNYVDLFEAFNAESEDLYFKTDSHWNADGALLAANALLEAVGKDAVEEFSATENSEFVGDINAMLYPLTAYPEPTLDIDAGAWDYVGNSSSVEDASIETKASGAGGLLMFRDSFANNLIPLLAPQFETAHFSKLVPYNLTLVDSLQPDTVIVERAERHIDLFLENPPLMPAPRVRLEVEGELAWAEELAGVEPHFRIDSYQDGDFMVLQGGIDGALIGAKDEIYLQVTDEAGTSSKYVPYYIPTSALSSATGASGEEVSEELAPVEELGVGEENLFGNEEEDCGVKAFLPLNAFSGEKYTATILVLKADSGKVYTAGSQVLQK